MTWVYAICGPSLQKILYERTRERNQCCYRTYVQRYDKIQFVQPQM